MYVETVLEGNIYQLDVKGESIHAQEWEERVCDITTNALEATLSVKKTTSDD